MFPDRMVVIFVLLWSSSRACDTNQSCPVDVNDPNIKSVLTSMDYFTSQLIQKLYNSQQWSVSPVILSPMCIFTMLVLVLFGSAGNTQTELYKVLQFPDGDLQQLQISFANILKATTSKRTSGNEDVLSAGHVAEGIFIQKEFALVKDYADYLNSINLQTQLVNFLNTQEAADAISRWVDQNKPPSESSVSSYSSSGNTRVYWTSLFFLTAKWENNLFLDIAPEIVPFHTLDKRIVDVQMMRAKISLLHYSGNSFSAVEIPFEGRDFTALYIVPSQDPATFVTTFKMSVVQEFYTNAVQKDVDCQVPTISYTLAYGLNNQLDAMGVKELFGQADLTRMLQVPKQDLGVQTAHYVELTLNEKGAMADSLSLQPVQKNPPSQSLTPFLADRPVLVLVRCTASQAIAFATFIHMSSIL